MKSVTFGVRPENLTLGGTGIPVTVDLVEELGADSFVHGHGPDGDRMVIRTEARVHPTAGATVHAMVTDSDHVHVFNPDTGERLRSSAEVPADSVVVAGSAASTVDQAAASPTPSTSAAEVPAD